jgi:chemotaxis protein MotB
MARRGKKPEIPENHERWLITYADLITLLLVFFIIMYSMSQVDQSKYESLSRSLNLQFNKADSILEMNSGLSGIMNPTMSNAIDGNLDQKNEEKELTEFKEQIDTYIKEHNLETEVTVADTTRGITITLNDVFLFDLGKAELKPPAFDIMNHLATLLPELDAKVAIEGHTDNVPMKTGSYYKDNWELSLQRSLSVLRYLTGKVNMDENKFIVTGYADTMPKVDNDTPENRAKNRRVEITILR